MAEYEYPMDFLPVGIHGMAYSIEGLDENETDASKAITLNLLLLLIYSLY